MTRRLKPRLHKQNPPARVEEMKKNRGFQKPGFLGKYFVVAIKFAKNPVSLSECVSLDRPII